MKSKWKNSLARWSSMQRSTNREELNVFEDMKGQSDARRCSGGEGNEMKVEK